mmetsp:Transcript_1198/g.2400  ORF Transcript_1198/g.2400 Transcript_1198/m.2400 type:complete len:118 (-) Transcript_1198:54-407(-)
MDRFNVPAVLKGFFDRSLWPGRAFTMPDPTESKSALVSITPGLTNIKRLGVVTTYGSPSYITLAAGDNGRNMITRAILPLFSDQCTIRWLGLYDMDKQTQYSREHFLNYVESSFEQF